jgi:uncharacterized protein (TIGR03382 family)
MRQLGIGSVLLIGCAPLGDPADDFVESATLVNLDTNHLVVLTGPVGGDAILVYTTPDGRTGSLPVGVNGGAIGVLFAMSADLNMNDDVPLDLSDADEDLQVRDLLGTYGGSSWNVTLGFGGAGNRLKNGHGVRLSDEHFTVGVGMEVGLEWLRIREGGHEDGLDDDWTDDTADDTSGDTDASDTDVPPPDTSDDVDTSDPPPSSSGCDCEGDACGCASGGMLPAPFGFTAVLALLRRRKAAS